MQTKPHKKREKLTFLADTTPVDLDYNAKKPTKKLKKHNKKQDLKQSYTSPYDFNIKFKAIIIIKYKFTTPVAILIHSSTPHDSKIFTKIIKNLPKRRIIEKKTA